MTAPTLVDPESRSAAEWSGRLAGLNRDRADTDPDILECRQALAFHRVSRAIDRERGHLSRAAADRLCAMIAEAVGA